MGLLDDLRSTGYKRQGFKLDLILSELSDEERDEVLLVLGKLREKISDRNLHPQYSMKWLARVLTDNGHPIGEESIKRWLVAHG